MTRMIHAATRVAGAIPAFVLVWLAPLAGALASPPHGGEAAGGAEHGGHGAEHADGIKWFGDGVLGGPGEDGRTGYLILLINFVVLMFVLNKLLFRHLRSSNAEASDAIRLELERATKARGEAEALVQEYEVKLAALETEIDEIRAEAKASAEAEHAQILVEAREQGEKIKQAALRAGEREAARYRTELENEIVDRALANAEIAIRSGFGGSDQRRLVDAWVNEVSATTLGGAN